MKGMSPVIRTTLYGSIGAVASYLLVKDKYPDISIPAVIMGQAIGTIVAEVQNQKQLNYVQLQS
jgi:hypothetical protein